MAAVRIAGTWRTTAPPEHVWQVIADLRTWAQWWPAITDVQVLDGEPGAPDAARLTFDTPAPLRPLVVGLEVAERRAPDHLAVAAVDGPLTGTGTLSVTPTDEGSDTRFDLTVSVRSLLFRPVEVVLAGATRGHGRQRLRRAGDDLAALAGGEPLDHDI